MICKLSFLRFFTSPPLYPYFKFGNYIGKDSDSESESDAEPEPEAAPEPEEAMDDGVDDQDAAAGDIPSDASMAVVLHEGNICGDLPTSNLPIYTIFSCTPLTLPLFFLLTMGHSRSIPSQPRKEKRANTAIFSPSPFKPLSSLFLLLQN